MQALLKKKNEEEFVVQVIEDLRKMLEMGSDFFFKRNFQNICGIELNPLVAITQMQTWLA